MKKLPPLKRSSKVHLSPYYHPTKMKMDGRGLQDGLSWRRWALKPTGNNQQQPRGRGEEDVMIVGKRDEGAAVETAAEEAEAEEEPMSPVARMFRQPSFNCYIIVMMGSGKRIDVDVVKAGMEGTLLRHPRFSSVQAVNGGKPRWVPTRVVLEDHLVVVDPAPDGVDSPDDFVEDYVTSLSRAPLADFSRPLWDLHILNLRTSDAEAVAVFRIHHSLGDGISLTSLLLALTRKVSDPDSLPSLPGGGRRGVLPTVEADGGKGRWDRVLGFLVCLWAALRMAWNTVVDVLLFVATAVLLKDTETPVKGKEGVEHNPKRFVRRSLSMADVRVVKSATGSTINDVLLGVTTAGLTRYLCRRYEGENGSGKRRRLPKNIRMRSTLLLNLRPSQGIHALADMMEKGNKHDKGWGNWLGYVIVPFFIVKREDPLEYIHVAKSIADRKKCSFEAILTYSCARLIINIFGIKMAAALSHRVLSHTTLSFSNVVGPVEEITFFGHPIVYLAPSVHGHPHALTVHFQSYVDRMELIVAVDESIIPDPHRLCEDLADSLNQIKDAAVAIDSHS